MNGFTDLCKALITKSLSKLHEPQMVIDSTYCIYLIFWHLSSSRGHHLRQSKDWYGVTMLGRLTKETPRWSGFRVIHQPSQCWWPCQQVACLVWGLTAASLWCTAKRKVFIKLFLTGAHLTELEHLKTFHNSYPQLLLCKLMFSRSFHYRLSLMLLGLNIQMTIQWWLKMVTNWSWL